MEEKTGEKILIINYYWPPSGGPAVQRWLAFTERLPQFGISPIILTVDENYATYPMMDESLVKQVSPKVVVHKTKTKELFWMYKKTAGRGTIPTAAFANESNPGPLRKIARFIRGNFFIPDPRKGWKKYALPKALSLIREENIKVFVTCGPPHSTHLIGLKLKKQTEAKWIADFHDAWTDVMYYSHFYQTTLAKAYDAKLERTVLEQADAVLTVGEKLRQKLGAKSSNIGTNKIHLITMGYDEKIFAPLEVDPPQTKFTITYTGTISDFYKPEAFFDALVVALKSHENFPLKLRFVGLVSENVEAYMNQCGLKDYVELVPYVPHKEAVNYLTHSSLLFLINPQFQNEEGHIPGKLYEYLAVRKPILNIAPLQSDSARIIAECHSGETFERTQIKEMTRWLMSHMEIWNINKTCNLQSSEKLYEQFSRLNETRKLAEVVDGLIR